MPASVIGSVRQSAAKMSERKGHASLVQRILNKFLKNQEIHPAKTFQR